MYPNRQRRGRGGKMIFFPIIAGVIALGLGAVVRALWNAIMPDITHAGRISYWQSVGLLVLCRILVGGFGRGGFKGGGDRRGGHLRDRWKSMSDEEREALKARWKERCRK